MKILVIGDDKAKNAFLGTITPEGSTIIVPGCIKLPIDQDTTLDIWNLPDIASSKEAVASYAREADLVIVCKNDTSTTELPKVVEHLPKDMQRCTLINAQTRPTLPTSISQANFSKGENPPTPIPCNLNNKAVVLGALRQIASFIRTPVNSHYNAPFSRKEGEADIPKAHIHKSKSQSAFKKILTFLGISTLISMLKSRFKVSVLFQHDAHAALSLVYCACDERMVINSASEGIE